MNYIVLDFETYDPWIKQGRGSGWPEKQAKFLCAALYDSKYSRMSYTDCIEDVLADIKPGDCIVAHNALYEAGVLKSYGFDIESVTWIDTMVLAKLFFNNLRDFSLDGLAKFYLGEEKDDADLGYVAKSLGLVKNSKSNAVKAAKENMDKVFQEAPALVEKYVRQDVALTEKLFKYFMYDDEGAERFSSDTIEFHSDLIKQLVLMRAKGVRVNKDTAKSIQALLKLNLEDARERIAKLTAVKVTSSKQLAHYFDGEGIQYNLTKLGNPTITKDWMQKTEHPLCQSVVDFKKYEKLIKDFINPILELEGDRVYPELRIYGASATGRASCSNPNLQQVPKRSEDGELVRRCYVPEGGEEWYSLDYSSQESRIQVHYAGAIEAKGSAEFIEGYRINPKFDLHGKVAELINIKREDAKTINLGLSYGMRIPKLAQSLGVTRSKASKILTKYYELVPYLPTLTFFVEQRFTMQDYIVTIGGRKLYKGPRDARKALNKLIQGSAADQTWNALVTLYREGITPLFAVHDSIELSLPSKQIAEKVKEIMETCTPMLVPSLCDIKSGCSWGELK